MTDNWGAKPTFSVRLAIVGLQSPSKPELANDTVKRGRTSLGAPDAIVAPRGIPEQLKWPTVRAVMKKAAQGKAHLECIDTFNP